MLLKIALNISYDAEMQIHLKNSVVTEVCKYKCTLEILSQYGCIMVLPSPGI